MLPRKFSLPSQLCSMAGQMPATINPANGRKGSLCMNNPQYTFPCPNYNTQQWAQVGPLAPTAPPVGLQQGFLIPSGANKNGNSCGSTTLRTTQASWYKKVESCASWGWCRVIFKTIVLLSCPFTGRDSFDSLQRPVHVMWQESDQTCYLRAVMIQTIKSIFLGLDSRMCTLIQQGMEGLDWLSSLFGYTA